MFWGLRSAHTSVRSVETPSTRPHSSTHTRGKERERERERKGERGGESSATRMFSFFTSSSLSQSLVFLQTWLRSQPGSGTSASGFHTMSLGRIWPTQRPGWSTLKPATCCPRCRWPWGSSRCGSSSRGMICVWLDAFCRVWHSFGHPKLCVDLTDV